MTLNEACNFFNRLIQTTTNTSEIKVYERFIHLLSKLRSREFSKDEIQSIEAKLDSLNLELTSVGRKRYFKNALSRFETYLVETFSLVSKGHYTNIGIGLGSSFGVVFGIVFLSGLERSLDISLGLIVGMLIGVAIGRFLDRKAMSEGRVL